MVFPNIPEGDGTDGKFTQRDATDVPNSSPVQLLQPALSVTVMPATARHQCAGDDPLDIVYLNAVQVEIKSEGRLVNKAIYLAIGINLQGLKEVPGLWVAQAEDAKFWLSVVTELKNRGVQDIFIAAGAANHFANWAGKPRVFCV